MKALIVCVYCGVELSLKEIAYAGDVCFMCDRSLRDREAKEEARFGNTDEEKPDLT
jgi:hypothetical protein